MEKKTQFAILTLAIFFIASLFIISGCEQSEYEPGINDNVEDSSADNKGEGGGSDDSEEEPNTNILELLNHELKSEDNEFFMSWYVEGTAKNVGSSRVDYVQVNVRFYDENDILLETFFDNILDVDSGVTFKFKVMYIGDDTPNHYDISISNTLV